MATNVAFRPTKNTSYFSPTQDFIIPAGSTVSKDFRGLDGGNFGLNRLSIGTDIDSKNLIMTARLNNEKDIFTNIHVSALQAMFLARTLLAPFVIERGNFLTIIIKNNHATATANVAVQVLGFDEVVLGEWMEYKRANGQKIREPFLVSGYSTVAALEERKLINLTNRARPYLVHRLFAGSDGAVDLRLTLDIYNDTIKRDVFIDQLNDEFKYHQALVPYYVGGNIPVSLYVTNVSSTDVRNISIIGEGYFE
jgi:hypothetical protein